MSLPLVIVFIAVGETSRISKRYHIVLGSSSWLDLEAFCLGCVTAMSVFSSSAADPRESSISHSHVDSSMQHAHPCGS